MTREPGFYWVLSWGEWRPAEWYEGEWFICRGIELTIPDEIDERRIERDT